MKGFIVTCSSITWGSFRRENPDEWPETRILEEIAQAGYGAATAGPRGDRTPEETVELYARYGLKPAPGYLAGGYWKEEERAGILENAKRLAEFSRGLGLTEIFAGPSGSDYVTSRGQQRWELAAHVEPEDSMTDDEFKRMAECLNEVGRATLEQGVRVCFHNHVGQVVETREEIDRLFSLIDPELVFQGPDIGHLEWTGADPVQFCRDYADSIKCLHVKDIDPAVCEQGRREKWNYKAFSDHGIFAELGEGCVDFPAIFRVLADAGYDGWMIVETDRTQKPTALESATISREYLKSIGL